MAKVTQVDFPPREIVSYTKETQTPVVTQEKEGESLLTVVRLALARLGAGPPPPSFAEFFLGSAQIILGIFKSPDRILNSALIAGFCPIRCRKS